MPRSYRICLKDGAEVGRLLVSEWCRIDLEGKSFRITSSRDGRLVVELINPSFLPGVDKLPLREARASFERDYITSQIFRFMGNVTKTAEFIGMDRNALSRKIRDLGVIKRKTEKEAIAA